MARKVMCSNCKEKYYKEELKEHGSKRLCKTCYTEQLEMEKLRAYICKLYDMEYVTPKLQKQINDFVNLYCYKPKAIKMIIEYAIKVEKFEIDKSLESLTFVNYFRHNAIKYYTDKKEIMKSVKNAKKPELVIAYDSDSKTRPEIRKKTFDIENFDVEE